MQVEEGDDESRAPDLVSFPTYVHKTNFRLTKCVFHSQLTPKNASPFIIKIKIILRSRHTSSSSSRTGESWGIGCSLHPRGSLRTLILIPCSAKAFVSSVL